MYDEEIKNKKFSRKKTAAHYQIFRYVPILLVRSYSSSSSAATARGGPSLALVERREEVLLMLPELKVYPKSVRTAAAKIHQFSRQDTILYRTIVRHREPNY